MKDVAWPKRRNLPSMMSVRSSKGTRLEPALQHHLSPWRCWRAGFSLIPLLVLLSTSAALADPIRVACVGDSITYGANIKNRSDQCYPARLQGLLGKGYEVRNFGENGRTALKKGDLPYWKSPQLEKAKAFAPNIVILAFGTNDSKKRNWKHRADFNKDYEALIDVFANLPSKPRIIVCLPPPAFTRLDGINDKVIKDDIATALKALAKKRELTTIDLYQRFDGRRALFPDKIHPNALGARLLAEEVHRVVARKAQN